MSDVIHTRYHKYFENKNGKKPKEIFPEAPIYVIDDEIITSIESQQFDGAYKQVIDAGFGNLLPWPELILEFNLNKDIVEGEKTEDVMKQHCICHMKMQSASETADNGTGDKPADAIWVRSIVEMDVPAKYTNNGEIKNVVLTFERGVLVKASPDNPLEIVGIEPKVNDKEYGESLVQVEVDCARRAHYLALVILNVANIEKELIVPGEKLNKARVKKGQAIIPKHTVLRIGHVYDRKGERVKYVRGQTKIHLRCGHMRRQRYGKALSSVKLVYIPAILVNYKPNAVKEVKVKL